MNANVRGTCGVIVAALGLLVAPAVALAQFKAPPPPDCSRAVGIAKKPCEEDVKSYPQCAKLATSLQEYTDCMLDSRSDLQGTRNPRWGPGTKAAPTAFTPPPPRQDCNGARPDQKAMCEAERKSYPVCAQAAKSQDEFRNCMLERHKGYIGPQNNAAAKPPNAPAPAAATRPVPPPPDCSKVKSDQRAKCEAMAKSYPECAKLATNSKNELWPCIEKAGEKVLPPKAAAAFKPPPPPDCSKLKSNQVKSSQEAKCEAMAKAYPECAKTSKNAQDYLDCIYGHLKPSASAAPKKP